MYPFDYNPEAVILAAGDYPSHAVPLNMLQESERVICCDSAAQDFLTHEARLPWRVVGDGDSLKTEYRQRFAAILHSEAEQETNDLSKAFRFARAQGFHRLAFVGATGKREDHTLGNISLMIEYLRQGADVRMFTDHGVFIPCHNRANFEVPVGTQVSIINFGASQLQGEGLRWPLSDFSNWWQGTLNAAVSTEISITGNGDFLVFVNYPAHLL